MGEIRDIFTDMAVNEIYRYSPGVARKINKLCTACLPRLRNCGQAACGPDTKKDNRWPYGKADYWGGVQLVAKSPVRERSRTGLMSKIEGHGTWTDCGQIVRAATTGYCGRNWGIPSGLLSLFHPEGRSPTPAFIRLKSAATLMKLSGLSGGCNLRRPPVWAFRPAGNRARRVSKGTSPWPAGYEPINFKLTHFILNMPRITCLPAALTVPARDIVEGQEISPPRFFCRPKLVCTSEIINHCFTQTCKFLETRKPLGTRQGKIHQF